MGLPQHAILLHPFLESDMKHALVPTIVSLLATTGLDAGTTAITDSTPVPITGPVESDWSFRFAPYAWLIAIDGDIGIGPLTAPVDISFSDTLDKLDMAYMFLVEAGYSRWTLTADFVYGDFSNDYRRRRPALRQLPL